MVGIVESGSSQLDILLEDSIWIEKTNNFVSIYEQDRRQWYIAAEKYVVGEVVFAKVQESEGFLDLC